MKYLISLFTSIFIVILITITSIYIHATNQRINELNEYIINVESNVMALHQYIGQGELIDLTIEGE